MTALQRGETVRIRPRGHSMRPKVNDGDTVTVAPCDPAELDVGDIALVRVKGVDHSPVQDGLGSVFSTGAGRVVAYTNSPVERCANPM